MITSFQTKNMRGKKAPCKGLSIAMLDFVIKAKNPQGILEECKYEQERIKMENLFDDDLEKSLSDQSHNDSNDELESDDESNEQFAKAKKVF